MGNESPDEDKIIILSIFISVEIDTIRESASVVNMFDYFTILWMDFCDDLYAVTVILCIIIT